MPRIEFNNEQELRDWSETFCKGTNRYSAYITAGKEIVLEPRKSTDPIRYGYLRVQSEGKIQEIAAFLRELGLSVFTCTNYVFSSDHMVAK